MTPTRSARSAAVLLAAVLAAFAGAAPAAADTENPSLEQTIDPEMRVATDRHVLSIGHVDMGPTYVDDEWQLLIHDDAARADAGTQSVWRYPDATVLRVDEMSKQIVPDEPAYSFLGVAPGAPVWVVPQTQDPNVVWLGWNTQDPTVMSTIDHGVTLTLDGVHGPGALHVYLQSGSFGEPDVLWNSDAADAQSIWVDVNTHTHANWVFTQPGEYLIRMTASADLIDGSTVSDTQTLRFAVGDAASDDAAFALAWEGDGTKDPQSSATPSATGAAVPTGSDPLVPVLIGAIGVIGAVIVVIAVVISVRASRARRGVFAARADREGVSGHEETAR